MPAAPGSAPRRKRRSAEEILARILEAAATEFERSGYTGATTAAIAREADVTEAQLFRYFDSKGALFREAIFKPLNQHFCDFRARHLGEADGRRDRRAVTADYITELQRFIGDHARMLTSFVVAQTYAAHGSQAAGEIEGLNAYFDRGADMMARRIGPGAQVDPKLMVRVSFAAVLASVTFKDWLFPPGLASDADIEAAIGAFVLDGINANTGPND